MARTSAILCAGGAVCLLLAGCGQLDSFSLKYFQSSTPQPGQVVNGSLADVSIRAQGALGKLGMSAVSTHEGDAIRITSTTASGKKFSLLLTQEKTPQGEHTRIKVEWVNGADDEMWTKILAALVLDSPR